MNSRQGFAMKRDLPIRPIQSGPLTDPITAGFVISYLINRANRIPFLYPRRAAPQVVGIIAVRGWVQNSGYTEAISPWLPWIKVG